MKEYIQRLRQRFDNIPHLAGFMGVSPLTIKAWQLGRRKPRGVELRMLEVLGILAAEQPGLLAQLAAAHRVTEQQEQLLKMPYIPTMTRPLVKQESHWSDEYWFARTVTDRRNDPEIEHDPGMFEGWADSRVTKYWKSCENYERRTGRIYPN